jgi:hypothetical protein
VIDQQLKVQLYELVVERVQFAKRGNVKNSVIKQGNFLLKGDWPGMNLQSDRAGLELQTSMDSNQC